MFDVTTHHSKYIIIIFKLSYSSAGPCTFTNFILKLFKNNLLCKIIVLTSQKLELGATAETYNCRNEGVKLQTTTP